MTWWAWVVLGVLCLLLWIALYNALWDRAERQAEARWRAPRLHDFGEPVNGEQDMHQEDTR